MGNGSYSVTNAVNRATSMHYHTSSTAQVFKQRSINNAMSPYGVGVRESRDSDEHPNSLAIIIGLDVTGSMGTVPHHLVKEGLPDIMDKIIKGGIPDPQVLFVGVGDHVYDSSPLQVGQFESSDELLDKWLTTVWLEGGGGGNEGESYSLAWYFAAKHTAIDCMEKRGKKGLLFTIGDEPALKKVPKSVIKDLIGSKQASSYTDHELLAMAMENYEVYHINICETYSGRRPIVEDSWREVISDNLIMAAKKEDVPGIIAEITLKHAGVNGQQQKIAEPVAPEAEVAEEIML